MVSSGTAVVTLPTDKQILITREFAAPKELVFKAYTTPELVERWWAGRRGKVTSVEIDLRVGGRWRFVMVTPDNFEVAFHGTYTEIVEGERLVSTEVYEGVPVPEGEEEQGTLNTLTLTEVEGRTRLEVLVDCPTTEIRDMIVESGMEGGMQESYDLLEQVAISLS